MGILKKVAVGGPLVYQFLDLMMMVRVTVKMKVRVRFLVGFWIAKLQCDFLLISVKGIARIKLKFNATSSG